MSIVGSIKGCFSGRREGNSQPTLIVCIFFYLNQLAFLQPLHHAGDVASCAQKVMGKVCDG